MIEKLVKRIDQLNKRRFKKDDDDDNDNDDDVVCSRSHSGPEAPLVLRRPQPGDHRQGHGQEQFRRTFCFHLHQLQPIR